MRRRSLLATAVAAAATLALTACGTTEAAEPTAAATTSAAPITLTDATGATVTLEGPATKVIGTEWNVVENLISLGVDPIGVADVKGYGNWSSAVPLKNTPTDIGTRGEPSVDTIASLAPDLVVTTTDLPAAAVEQLKEIAPVLVVRSALASAQIDQMITNLDLIATATGTQETATEITTAFREKLSTSKAALAAAGVGGQKFAFADGWLNANQIDLRPYAAGSLIGDVTTELGLINAWELTGDEAYGLAATDVEGLTNLPADVRFLYILNAADGGAEFEKTLTDNAVWKSLPFVQNDQVHRLPDGIWMFGGPASMNAYVDAVVTALTT